MAALLEPTEKPVKTEPAESPDKVIPDAQNATQNSKLWLWLDIPGRSVNPEKLTAFLRSNFGIGAYDIMVRVTDIFATNSNNILDGSQHVYYWNTEGTLCRRDR
jgi:hypothetical protein